MKEKKKIVLAGDPNNKFCIRYLVNIYLYNPKSKTYLKMKREKKNDTKSNSFKSKLREKKHYSRTDYDRFLSKISRNL